jgi:hypothetical protein
LSRAGGWWEEIAGGHQMPGGATQADILHLFGQVAPPLQ